MRAGDTVKHRPSGETWTVAYVEGEWLAWCGWPEGEAEVANCELVEACSDEEHREMLERWAELNCTGTRDRRAVVCSRQLYDLNKAYIGAGL